MIRAPRYLQYVAIAAAAASLAACGGVPLDQRASTYPTSTTTTPVAQETGRVTGIEFVPGQTAAQTRGPNVLGAVVGGVAGAVLGRQVGGGRGRDAATVLGGVAGAAVGSQVGGQAGSAPPPANASGGVYRITVQTDQGLMRTYEVGATGDLRVGDRVRVDNGVIYRA